MRRILSILFFGLIIIGCGNDEKSHSGNSGKPENLKKEIIDSLVISKIDSAQIPAGIVFNGKFKQGFKWTDRNGKNLVFLTETGAFVDKNIKHEFEYSADAELYAYCYDLDSTQPALKWKIFDFIRDCPVDIVAEFIANSLEITDLDKNGIAEVWAIYKTVCHSDVSPLDMKIIMYEGVQKYAIRGENRIQTGIGDSGKPVYMGGDYKMDDNFKKGPVVFRNYGEKLWRQYSIDTVE